MKVRFVKDWVGNRISFRKGEVQDVGRQFGKRLIKQGKAKRTDEVSPTDVVVARSKAEKAEEILGTYPERAKAIAERIEKEENEVVLNALTEDDRKTVREAAQKRLNSIQYGDF